MEDVKFKIEISGTGIVSVNEHGINEIKARDIINQLKEKHKNNLVFVRILQSCEMSFGFSSFSGEGYQVSISGYRERIKTDIRHRCARRNENPNPNFMISEGGTVDAPDIWEKIGDDLVCSYCGSLHPDNVLTLIKEKGFSVLEFSTKPYKWYIKRKDVPNASYGGIKYYRQHDTPEFVDALNELYMNQK